MVWVQTEVTATIVANVSPERAFEFVSDVIRTARLFPGMSEVRKCSDGCYAFVLEERRALGQRFRGEYVARYVERHGRRLVWETISGNMRSSGFWAIAPVADGARVSVTLQTGLDAPIPGLLRAPAALFTSMETQRCADRQLRAIRTQLESHANEGALAGRA